MSSEPQGHVVLGTVGMTLENTEVSQLEMNESWRWNQTGQNPGDE